MASLTVDQIVSLFSAERTGISSDFKLMGSTTQDACHNYKLTGTSSCGSLAAITIYLEIPAFDPLEYSRTRKGIKLGDETDYYSWRRLSPIISFPVIVDANIQNAIELLNEHREKKFVNLETLDEVDVDDIQTRASEEDEAVRLQVQLVLKNAERITKVCCGSFYAGEPQNECDGGGETGDPNNDPVCVGFEVDIEFNDDPVDTLHAALTGEPDNGGLLVYTWYKGKELIAQGTFPTIQTDGPDLYKVVVSKGNCQVEAEYLYSGPCGGYEVAIESVILSDGTYVLVAKPTRVSTLQWQVDTGSGFEDIAGATGIVYYPEVDGTYRVLGDSSGCIDDSNTLLLDLPVDCTTLFNVTLALDEDTLTSEISGYGGVGSPTYQWSADTGAGLTEIPGAESADYEPTTAGYYQLEVSLDGCTKTAGILYVSDCVSFKAYIAKLVESLGDIQITGASRNAPDDVDYHWYTREGDKWELQLSGNPFTLTSKRAVKLVAISGACTKTEELYFCADPDSVTPYEKFLGSVALETEFLVTAFTVPQGTDQGGALTPNDINAGWDVWRNGKKLYYVALAALSGASSTDINAFSFNYSENKLGLPTGQPAYDGDVFEVRQL